MVVSNIFDFHPGSLQNDKRWSLKGPQGWPYYIGNWCYFTPKTMESYRAPTALTGRSPLWCTWLISTGVSYELYRVYIYNIYIYVFIFTSYSASKLHLLPSICSFFWGNSDYLADWSRDQTPTSQRTHFSAQGERREDKKGLGVEKRKSEELCHRRHSCHRILSHRIHGTGIFTYMTGWFLW